MLGKVILLPEINDPDNGLEVPFDDWDKIEYLKDFYQEILKSIESYNISILRVVHHTSFHQKYYYVKDGTQLIMNYYFNKNGQFKFFQPQPGYTEEFLKIMEKIHA